LELRRTSNCKAEITLSYSTFYVGSLVQALDDVLVRNMFRKIPVKLGGGEAANEMLEPTHPERLQKKKKKDKKDKGKKDDKKKPAKDADETKPLKKDEDNKGDGAKKEEEKKPEKNE